MPSALVGLSNGNPAPNSVKPSNINSIFGGFFRNRLINGNFDIAQRNTSFSTPSNGAYTLDRWVVAYDGTIGSFTLSQQAFTVGQTDVPNEPTSFLRWNHTSAGSGSAYRRIEQRIEGVRTLPTKDVYVTFYAKADASRNMDVALVQNFGSGGSADVTTALATAALTTSWQKFTMTIQLPGISGKTIGAGNYLGLRFSLPINTTMTVDISQVQLEVGDGATPFEYRPIGLELLLAQRFYQIVPMAITASNTSIPMKATMRTTPTPAGGGAGFATTNLSASGGSALQTSPDNINITLEAEL